MNYQMMNAHSTEDITDVDSTLLCLVVAALTPTQKKAIATKLEFQRAHFANANTPGHAEWYATKLAMCARFDALT